MIKPKGYDEAAVIRSEYKRLSLGPHKCKIITAREQTSRAGNPFIVITFDIERPDNDAGYFASQYKRISEKNGEAKWPASATYWQGCGEQNVQFLKAFITAIEESNPGYTFDWEPESLKGKVFCGVFGEEEYQASDGSIKTTTKCRFVRSVASMSEIEVPEKKTLRNASTPSVSTFEKAIDTAIPLDMDDLPF